MRFKYMIGLAVVLPFMAFGFVFAQTGGQNLENLPTRQNMMTQPDDAESGTINCDELTEAIRMRQSRCANLSQLTEKTREMRVKAMGALMQVQIRRAENALNRLDNLLERVESRREKLSEGSANLDEADALIEKAKGHQESAMEALDKAKNDFAALEGSETPRQSVQTFMQSMRSLKTELIGFHRSLMESVKAMRKAVPNPDETTINQ